MTSTSESRRTVALKLFFLPLMVSEIMRACDGKEIDEANYAHRRRASSSASGVGLWRQPRRSAARRGVEVLVHQPGQAGGVEIAVLVAHARDRRAQVGQREAAAEAYERALALCGNSAERAYLQRRRDEMLNYQSTK